MPPDSPPAAVAALRQALIALNDDADFIAVLADIVMAAA